MCQPNYYRPGVVRTHAQIVDILREKHGITMTRQGVVAAERRALAKIKAALMASPTFTNLTRKGRDFGA